MVTPAAAQNGGRTGYPPGLLQDDCAELSRWLAERAGARRCVREVAREIEARRKHG